MRIEIVQEKGLKQEVWAFDLIVDSSGGTLYFESYILLAKATLLHRKWRQQERWDRHALHVVRSWENNIPRPTVPPEIEQRLRKELTELFAKLPIKL